MEHAVGPAEGHGGNAHCQRGAGHGLWTGVRNPASHLALGHYGGRGIWSGVDPVKAAEFSFLMSIPVIAGAAVLEIPHLKGGVNTVGAESLLIAFIASMAGGIFAIRWLLAMLRRRTFYQWAPYCWLIGLATIIWSF